MEVFKEHMKTAHGAPEEEDETTKLREKIARLQKLLDTERVLKKQAEKRSVAESLCRGVAEEEIARLQKQLAKKDEAKSVL